MKPYQRGELVFIRARVVHDFRGPGPHPLSVWDGTNGAVPSEAHPGAVVLIETVGPSGVMDRPGNCMTRVPAAHVVSVDEIKRKLGARRDSE